MPLREFNLLSESDKFLAPGGGPLFYSGAFLQSRIWAELLRQEKKIIMGWAYETPDFSTGMIMEENYLPCLGKYYYCPKGPIFSGAAVLPETYIDDWSKLARSKKIIFLRLETTATRLEQIRFQVKTEPKLKLYKVRDIQPATTLYLDLNKSEAELLAAQHQKTRYNIRLAEKKGVRVRLGQATDFPIFWELMRATARRDRFGLHPAAHYKNLLSQPEFIKLYLAEYQGRVITAGMFSFFGSTVTYLHGASDNSARSLMAPYLLQWTVIRRAQEQGFKYYDFYGINEKKWPGVTRFKLGWGGIRAETPGTYDLVFQTRVYRKYKILKILKSWLLFSHKK